MTPQMHSKIIRHTKFSLSDYTYLSNKGYSDREILTVWNRDVRAGKTKPVHHKPIPALTQAVTGY